MSKKITAPKPAASKKLPFYVVQEGIWKNRASERLRSFLSIKFSERAEIELRYVRLLQDWMDGVNPPIDKSDGSDSYMDAAIIKSVLECLKTEARSQINSHQRVYNSVMNDLGPYSAIRREVTSENRSLPWVEERFAILDRNRLKKEKEEKLRLEKKEHLSNQIETLENQLSQRSRITSARRSSRQGAKKVDGMRLRVSFLRRQLQEEEDVIEGVQKDLQTIETSSATDLANMETVLKNLEKIRMQNILQQTRMFIQSMLNQQTHARRSACTGDSLRQCVVEINDVEKQLDKNWDDVELNAQRSQAGQLFKLRQLFSVPVKKPTSADSRKSVDSLRIAEIEASRVNDEVDYMSQNLEDESLIQDGKEDRKPLLKDGLNSQYEHIKSMNTKNKDVISDSSIEDLNLPPETKNRSSRPNVRKDFWIRTNSKDDTSESLQQDTATEYTQIHQLEQTNSSVASSPTDKGLFDVGQFRNIRVYAKADYIATGPGELSFKKGQIIKQKAGENENGFCYGWTRDHLLFPKRYGYYPKDAVCFRCFTE